ncbi:MAG: ParA family protein, partial [Spirochaetes bacterium]|nr:ParA family protein [Spirochaetota bacterium]
MKHPIIITISQRKGGVGKSTSTINLAHVLAEEGYKVLIIDLDDQQNTTRSISTSLKAGTSGILSAGKNIEDLLLKNDVTLKDVAIETEWENVYILPSSSNLSGVVKHLDGELGGHLILKEKLRDSKNFNFIILDTSPSLNILVINALCASDYMFIPLSSKYFSMQGLKQTLGSFKKVTSRLNADLKLLGIAFVNHDKRNVLANEIVRQVEDKYTELLFKTIIGINIKIEEAQVKKQSIINYAPEDRGSAQYRDLGIEIVGRIIADEKGLR